MSFGALSAQAKEALGRGASEAGTSTTTGDGGMTPEETRAFTRRWSTSIIPSRYRHEPGRFAPRPMRSRLSSAKARSPAGAACCWGRRFLTAWLKCAPCPRGSTSGPPAVTRIGLARMIWKSRILELRRNYRLASADLCEGRRHADRIMTWRLAVKAGADVRGARTGCKAARRATQDVFIEHVGLPTLACIRPAVRALQDLGVHREVQLIVSGGIRTGADVAKALALGADAVSIGTAAMIALGDNDPKYEAEYNALGNNGGAPMTTGTRGRDPAGSRARKTPSWGPPRPGPGGKRARRGLPQYLKGHDAGSPDQRAGVS